MGNKFTEPRSKVATPIISARVAAITKSFQSAQKTKKN